MKAPANGPAGNIATSVYVICVAVAMVLVVSNFQSLYLAGGIADDVRSNAERHLVGNEIARQVDIMAHDQSQISHWDASVVALGDEISDDFVRDELAGWLWEDFGIRNAVVVSPDGVPEVAIFETRLQDPAESGEFLVRNMDLVGKARQDFMDRRSAKDGGFVFAGNPLSSANPLYSYDIRKLDSQIGIVMSQAIIPDDKSVLRPGLPKVLLTFKPLTTALLAEMEANLGLSGFRIGDTETLSTHSPASIPAGNPASIVISRTHGQPELVAAWNSNPPSRVIWRESAPVLIGLFAFAVVALILLAGRYARMLGSLQRSEKQNRFLALHDVLTGLPNRLQFDKAVEEIIDRGGQRQCAVVCIDLDRFKAVNDTYGHQAGDTVIRTAASRIAETVGGAGMAARIGGDEFIVLLRNSTDRNQVQWLCDTIIERLCHEIRFEGGVAQIGASCGAAWWPVNGLTVKEVIRSADEALYRAKQMGRGRAFLASEGEGASRKQMKTGQAKAGQTGAGKGSGQSIAA